MNLLDFCIKNQFWEFADKSTIKTLLISYFYVFKLQVELVFPFNLFWS
jgi:hypothetical protein